MSTENDVGDPSPNTSGISRRGLLLGSGVGVTLGALTGVGATLGVQALTGGIPATDTSGGKNGTDTSRLVPARGEHQAGIARPATPQKNALVVVCDVAEDLDGSDVMAMLADMGGAIDELTDPELADRLVLPDGPGDLTITIGLGPRLVRMIDAELPGAEGLPPFASDGNLALHGGDVLVAVYSSDASALHAVVQAMLARAPGASQRWVQPGVRGAGEGTVVRNPLGYLDGIIVPHTPEELNENVWIADGAAQGGTIAVIRRLQLNVPRFQAQSVSAQDDVIGRERVSGVPLSGGTTDSDVNVLAKTAEGEYVIPAHAHVRAAHPSFTGSALMLRRGYAYSNNATAQEVEQGLLFMCFQNDIDVFVRTQRRMDEIDALLEYTTLTASASFLIVPGRRDDAPFGAGLSRSVGA